jgi:hypothetical protein
MVHDRVARGRPGVGRLCDRAAGEGVQERRLSDAGTAHQHDDEVRTFDVEVFGLAAQVGDEALQGCSSQWLQRKRVAGLQPDSQRPFEIAQRRRERP